MIAIATSLLGSGGCLSQTLVEIVAPGNPQGVALNPEPLPTPSPLWTLPDLPLRLDGRYAPAHRSLEIATRFPQPHSTTTTPSHPDEETLEIILATKRHAARY